MKSFPAVRHLQGAEGALTGRPSGTYWREIWRFDFASHSGIAPVASMVAASCRYAIKLGELRRRQDDFVTPQSYRSLRAGEVSSWH